METIIKRIENHYYNNDLIVRISFFPEKLNRRIMWSNKVERDYLFFKKVIKEEGFYFRYYISFADDMHLGTELDYIYLYKHESFLKGRKVYLKAKVVVEYCNGDLIPYVFDSNEKALSFQSRMMKMYMPRNVIKN
jgi:hypothetical protein